MGPSASLDAGARSAGSMMNATPAGAAPENAAVPEAPILARNPIRPASLHTIDESELSTLADLFRTSVADFADRPAVESFGKRMTYAELGQGRATLSRPGCRSRG